MAMAYAVAAKFMAITMLVSAAMSFHKNANAMDFELWVLCLFLASVSLFSFCLMCSSILSATFPLNVPLTILTSSSFLTGIDLQLCCFFSSGDSEADMILRRSEDGAVKCALRDFRLEEDTFGLNFIAVVRSCWSFAGFSFASTRVVWVIVLA